MAQITNNVSTELTTPAFAVAQAGKMRVSFYLRYDVEFGYDPLNLLISVNNGPYVDVIEAGGAFVTGGYDVTPANSPGVPHGSWGGQGSATQTIDTATLQAGDQIRFRYRFTSDESNPGGAQYVDDFVVVSAPQAPVPVPTLSEWAMILFGTILSGGAALYVERRRILG